MLRSNPYRNPALKNVKASVKDAPGQLMGLYVLNLDAAVGYLQLWDSLLANVTVGTTVPTWTFGVPASGILNIFQPEDPGGSGLLDFQAGLVVADTLAVDGSGAAPTNGLAVALRYA